MDSLINRFLIEEVLKLAHDAVEVDVENPCEDEGSFFNRLSKLARLIQGIFQKYDLVNYYVPVVKPKPRDQMTRNI